MTGLEYRRQLTLKFGKGISMVEMAAWRQEISSSESMSCWGEHRALQCRGWRDPIMMLYGQSPFLECSTKGDRRFSAFVAKVNGRSIVEQYQAAKVFEGGVTGLHWTKVKGRKAQNAEECCSL